MSTVIIEKVERKVPLWLMSFVVVLPTFFAFLAQSAANVALPHIAGAFGSTNDETKFVVTSYMIANGVFLPLTGWLERTLGRLNFLKIFISFFTIGSVICMLSPNLTVMIVGRIIQGVGGGILMPLSQSILLQEYPKDRKGEAMAIFIFAIMVSSIMGPTVGGLLVDYFSWHWIFVINIPIGILSLILIPLTVNDTKRKASNGVDFVGLLFLIFWLFSMQVVLDKGQQYGWFDCTWICWLSLFSLFSMLTFVVWELEVREPIVNLRVFKDSNFLIGTILGCMVNIMVSITVILLPQFYQTLMGYSASMTGIAMSTRIVSCSALLLMGKLCQMYDSRILIGLGFFFIGLSTLMWANLNLQISLASIVFQNLLFGVGIVFAVVPLSAIALGTVPREQISDAAGVHSLSKCTVSSCFVSIAASLSIMYAQVHQTYLVKNMSVYSAQYVRHFTVLKGFFAHNFPLVEAAKRADVVLYKELLSQAKLSAYADIFQFAAICSFVVIALVFFLKVDKNKA